jgi:hypothetical protein
MARYVAINKTTMASGGLLDAFHGAWRSTPLPVRSISPGDESEIRELVYA